MGYELRGFNARLISGGDEVECRYRVSAVDFSLAEVMGRICYCGFAIDGYAEEWGLMRVRAHRVGAAVDGGRERRYGAIISLPRVGYMGRGVNVFKFRTMYPYSEYLQEWMYDNHHLSKSGKFADDFRITAAGKVLRRWSLDEIPMLYNWLRGDIKLVGVRPLSRQYFSLYSEELQRMRVRFKPGLFPPYYADMPRSFREIEESEMRYLSMCERQGRGVVDFHYFWQILINIIFKGKRNC